MKVKPLPPSYGSIWHRKADIIHISSDLYRTHVRRNAQLHESYCNDVCNIIVYWTALKRTQPILGYVHLRNGYFKVYQTQYIHYIFSYQDQN